MSILGRCSSGGHKNAVVRAEKKIERKITTSGLESFSIRPARYRGSHNNSGFTVRSSTVGLILSRCSLAVSADD